MAGDPRQTPAMQQYFRFKEAHPGCVLLFRMGDFYEVFDQDAVTLSKALGITLTQRSEGLPMAGVPHHQIEVYLARLINQGFRVAVAEQMQDPKETKGLIERQVTRVVTAGTRVDDSLLADDAPCTLAAVSFHGDGNDSPAGVALIELSTGAFVLTECTAATLVDELSRRGVSELLYCATTNDKPAPRVARVLQALNIVGTPRPPWQFRADEAKQTLLTHFGVSTLAGFGLREDDPALPAAGAAIQYLKQTQALTDERGKPITPSATATITSSSLSAAVGARARRPTRDPQRPPRRESAEDSCVIDAVSLRALEIERTLRAGQRIEVSQGPGPRAADPSLLSLFLSTPNAFVTPMGKRLLRDWLCRPLARVDPILARQRCIATLVSDRRSADELRGFLSGVQDVARIAGRIALARATPRDLVALGKSLARIPELIALTAPSPAFATHAASLRAVGTPLTALATTITSHCVDTPPPHLREGGLIRPGVDAALDEARTLQTDADAWLIAYQERFAAQHDLPGIKVGYNRVFGYYIELTSTQSKALAGRGIPPPLIRKQSLKNAERFTTTELAELEAKITTAQSRALERERELFEKLCTLAAAATPHIAQYAQTVAELDALAGLAERAHRRGWVRPDITEHPTLVIHAGRHPVLEEILGSNFVPNDIELGGPANTDALDPAITPDATLATHPALALITGPNMAGKSTFIRQTALITLLAQVGSFVPADRATIGLCDRIFTRIGADDALHAGQSTFMVEMTETANILNHATPRSLIILDEIGRGTSTLDGLSLAWAVTEFLAGSTREPSEPTPRPRTLFATHYHELTELEDRLAGRVKNLHVQVREWPGQPGPDGKSHGEIIFLHRIVPGRSDQSYGIHVAKLAGIPREVIDRAREVLGSLNVQHGPATKPSTQAITSNARASRAAASPPAQLSLFTEYLSHPAIDQLRELKLDSMTPLLAFDELRKLRALLDQSSNELKQ